MGTVFKPLMKTYYSIKYLQLYPCHNDGSNFMCTGTRTFMTRHYKSHIFDNIPCQIYYVKRNMLKHSINHIISKKVIDRYMRLPVPLSKVLATYVWIDGSGINVRSRDRVLNCVPYSPDAAPTWMFDGSACGQARIEDSDTVLKPVCVYRDPFRLDPHVLLLCEVYHPGNKPVATNHRRHCLELCEAYRSEQPWFGLEQEYTMMDVDGWGLGWPKGGGFPAVKYQYSYCGVGAKYVVGREVCEAHCKACLFAGCEYDGANPSVCHASWQFQIGTCAGIKAADDLWMARYLIGRIAEEYGIDISYHPKPFGMLHPGIGMHNNFSTETMRNKGGYKFIQECVKKLEKNHAKHMKYYSNQAWSNKLRLTGQFRTSRFQKFAFGVGNRKASVRVNCFTKSEGMGYLEDRRPGGDCDPYVVCKLILETCLGDLPKKPAPVCPNPCK